MKTIADKEVLVGADFAGCGLKNAIVEHLEGKGWKVTDVGVKTPDDENPEMFHRIGFKVGSMISEGEFERALIFCGTGMGIHIGASQCPRVHCAVVESVPSALRCITGNACNVMAMGGFYIGPRMGMAMADAFLENDFCDGYEDWEGFYEFHKIAVDEIDAFDYEEYKANGFKVKDPRNCDLAPMPEGRAW